MKKTISLFLSVLMLLSVFGMFAAAEDTQTYTVTFVVNGTTVSTQTVAEGETPEAPAEPAAYTDDEGKVYEFHAWISSVETDPEKRFYPDTLPAVTSDVTYTAEFYVTFEPSKDTTVTLFSFLQSIFQNITKVFAAATDTVKTWTDHIGIASDFVKELFENVF